MAPPETQSLLPLCNRKLGKSVGNRVCPLLHINDGYDNSNSTRILDIPKEKRGRGTFFRPCLFQTLLTVLRCPIFGQIVAILEHFKGEWYQVYSQEVCHTKRVALKNYYIFWEKKEASSSHNQQLRKILPLDLQYAKSSAFQKTKGLLLYIYISSHPLITRRIDRLNYALSQVNKEL